MEVDHVGNAFFQLNGKKGKGKGRKGKGRGDSGQEENKKGKGKSQNSDSKNSNGKGPDKDITCYLSGEKSSNSPASSAYRACS